MISNQPVVQCRRALAPAPLTSFAQEPMKGEDFRRLAELPRNWKPNDSKAFRSRNGMRRWVGSTDPLKICRCNSNFLQAASSYCNQFSTGQTR